MSSDRNRKYQLHGPKGAAGICVARRFLTWLGISHQEILGEENYREGDLRILPSNETVEVKSQPIRPKWVDLNGLDHNTAKPCYAQNFVEVFEVETKHDQVAELAETMGYSEADLKNLTFTHFKDENTVALLNNISFSLSAIHTACAYFYCNNAPQVDGRYYLCAYPSSSLFQLVRESMSTGGMRRMPGKRGGSNEDTIGVNVDYPKAMFWYEDPNSHDWLWCGTEGTAEGSRTTFRSLLGLES